MRVKEIDRTANIAWSPASHHPIYMVTGTAAQQLDATFSTSAALEMHSLNLADTSLDMPLVASIPSDYRFHKLLWGSFGNNTKDLSAGLIVAGADNGNLLAYNAAKIIQNDPDCLIFEKDRHVGAVKALDFNPFQANLLASGGAESEIFIWDLSNPETPMTPGAKSQPPEEVACVAWNKQVQHILGSTFSTRCVVWDLRKNEPIIKVSDSMSRIKCKQVAWHPEVATQMCISSEDDHTPVIQLWDLRYATSPVKVLENHQRGVLSIAWCQQDPDLLLSCGKDNRILCWNISSAAPNGEVVYEVPTSHQWSFDVQWCPRNPSIISSSSFDGHVTVYSLMGGGHPVQRPNKVVDSFKASDPFSQTAANQLSECQNIVPLQKPPKWLKKPSAANFGFGGKLVSIENVKPQNPHQSVSRTVHISQVVTETEFLSRSVQLEQALMNGQHTEFCAMKAANCTDSMQENIWNFIRVNFEKEPRERYIQLLGYDKTELAKKVAEYSGDDVLSLSRNAAVNADVLAEKMSKLGTGDLSHNGFDSNDQASPSVGSKTPGSQDEINFSDGSSAFDEIASQTKPQKTKSPLVIPSDDDADGLMGQALLTGNFEAAVDMCLNENKMAEAILLAIAGGPELLSRTQKRYFLKNHSNLGRLISAIVTHDWSHIVCTCELENWKEALTVVLTYASAEDFASLCDTLAARLETERDGDLSAYASLCYICSGNLEKLVQNWLSTTDHTNSPLALQDLVEKVMVLRKAVELSRGRTPEFGSGLLSEKLSEYANLLAAQGSLKTAISYLGNPQEEKLAVLQDRLYQALGQPVAGSTASAPIKRVSIHGPGAQQQDSKAPTQTSQPQVKAYQTQANGGFATSTTSSVSYAGQNQFSAQTQYSGSYQNGPLTTPVTGYNTMPVMSQAMPTPAPLAKGPLSQKYPHYPQSSGSAYGVNTYPAPSYQQDLTQQQYSQQNYYSGTSYVIPPTQSAGVQPYSPPSPDGPRSQQLGSHQPSAPHRASFMDSKPDKAWNDPPIVKEKKVTKTPFEALAPITSPIYGFDGQQTLPNEQVPSGAPIGYTNLYNPQEHHNEVQKASALVPEPVKEVEKGPIPAEHQILKDIFDHLVHNCLAKAQNVQAKRKLEDVNKKLEILYDRLRNNSLSQNVILGLHQIVQAIQQYDYNSGLSVYTHMVSQSNFSEISNFMPGLKMLIQSALQMQVYVQAQ
ncbi:hypothetical protein ACJMK2_034299 [Sinanodonta woodiana]|uniref:Protein transport protein Sec31A n=1 Tax=Sinanodonta woodiana TaxID=1069815 RepID=A0ABD3WR45_SINWO